MSNSLVPSCFSDYNFSFPCPKPWLSKFGHSEFDLIWFFFFVINQGIKCSCMCWEYSYSYYIHILIKILKPLWISCKCITTKMKTRIVKSWLLDNSNRLWHYRSLQIELPSSKVTSITVKCNIHNNASLILIIKKQPPLFLEDFLSTKI